MSLYKSIFSFIWLFIIIIMLCGCQNNDITQDPMIPDNKQSEDSVKNEDIPAPSGHSTLPQTSPSNEIPPVSSTTMYVKLNHYGSQLNIRESPSISDNIIGKLTHGDSIQVISIQDGWAIVEFNQDVGYIKADYLVDEEPSQLLPPHESVSPDELYINVYKSRRVLELWNGDELIGEYNIALGFNPIGHKEKEGDGKTPEGAYYICLKNPNSRFYLSLGISYPGIADAQRGLATGLITQNEHDRIINAITSGGVPPWNTPLGGEVMVHGSGAKDDWTEGCIAVDNDVMDILWEYCTVGTKIFIFP